MIQEGCFWKEIQLATTFSEIEKAKFQCYPGQKCVQIAAENSNVFWAFLKIFTGCICFLSNLFFKNLSSEAKGKDKPIGLNRFDVDPLLKFWKKIEDNAEFVLSSAPVQYFGHNFLFKIPIDSRLDFFERKFNYLQRFQK